MLQVVPPFASASERRALGAEAECYISRATVMIRRARAIVAQDRRHSAGLLNLRQHELARHLGAYQCFKHSRIFDPVITRGKPSSQIVARTMKTDCVLMGHTFGAYHERWSGMDGANWPGYRSEMLAMTETVLGFLEEEQRAINQLLMISSFYDIAGTAGLASVGSAGA